MFFFFYPLSNCLRLARSSAVGMAPGSRLISKKGEYYTPHMRINGELTNRAA